MTPKATRLLYPKQVTNISPEQASELIYNQTVTILDVRERDEFEVSHLQNARLYTSNSLTETSTDQQILLYCTVGVRSARLAKELQAKGFTHVYNLDMGIINWKNSGRAVVKSENQPTEKVHVYNSFFGLWLKNGEAVK